jgi:hypothetical protein
MNNQNIDVLLENQTLKAEFTARGLDLDQVFWFTPDDLERENHVLRHLLDWVQKYTECPDRQKMISEGYEFPPIDPDISPEEDWYRFELWMQGKPIRQKLKEQIRYSGPPKPADEMTDEEIQAELQKLARLLEEVHICVDINEDMPLRLAYEYLLETLDEEMDVFGEGTWHLDGCGGYCPGCFQRPWCETGNRSCWPEDEEEGKMFLIDPVKKYVSASPISLKLLRQAQEEEDRKFAEFKEKQKDSGIAIDPRWLDPADDDDLPF